MSDELLYDELTRCGLRRVHVARMGAKPDRARWLERVPGEALGLLSAYEYEEERIGVHHLYLVWQARQMVELVPAADGRSGVLAAMWYIDTGETLRDAADCAGTLYQIKTGRWPTAILTSELPKGVAEGTAVTVQCEAGTVEVALRVARWAPKRYALAVGDGWEEVQRHG